MQYSRRMRIQGRIICHFTEGGKSNVGGFRVVLLLSLQWQRDYSDCLRRLIAAEALYSRVICVGTLAFGVFSIILIVFIRIR